MKLNERRMLGTTGGKICRSFQLQSLLYTGVQLFEQAADVEHMTTGEDMMGKSVDVSACRQHPSPASPPPESICPFV